MSGPLLDVRDLRTSFDTPHGRLRAVDGVSFTLGANEALGIVGESGSGKSVTALSILKLFGPVARRHVRVDGEVLFEGRNLLKLSESDLRHVRGAQIGLVFQDPLTSLNPSMPVGEQVAEPLRVHRGLNRNQARQRAIELLHLVGIPEPSRRVDDQPYRFSGGQRQRILIATAVACEPKLLIADEPTTALDVTVQAQILVLLNRLRRELGMALLMISHDFGVIAATCDRVQVMYGGRLLESGAVQHILERPNHPYTAALLRLVPRLDGIRGHRPRPIPGHPPIVVGEPTGCRFAARCEYVVDRCRDEEPPLVHVGPAHTSACWFATERTGDAVENQPWATHQPVMLSEAKDPRLEGWKDPSQAQG